ncbi:hypothetical protein SCUCBS95973_004626 [Sporothrix curviconia]|uniref:Cytochrome P450 monooxygenase n=1 Tax=Sporothrix curviconia TaxID=1260050 RepID=A0ABP0BQ75_9PEZI
MSSSSSFSASLLPVTLLSLAGFAIYRLLVYPLFISPLAKIPSAHWSSAISPLWILYVRFKQNETETLAGVHEALGPVVRVGPNDVSVNDIGFAKTIHTSFNRTKYYSIFVNYDTSCMFSTIPSKEHAMRKRLVSHVYTKTFIQSSPTVASQARAILLDRLLPVITASTAAGQESHGIEVSALFMATSMDFITAHGYGLAGGTDFLHRTVYCEHWIQTYITRFQALFYLQELSGITRFLAKVGMRLQPRTSIQAKAELEDWNQGMFDRTAVRLADHSGLQDDGVLAESRTKTTRLSDDSDALKTTFAWGQPEDEPTVMLSLLSSLEREQAAHKVDRALYDKILREPVLMAQSELYDHIIAGQETTAMTLTYLAWKLAVHQDVQGLLRAELLSLQKSEDDPSAPFFPDAKTLDALPVLHAVIMETLRLHAPFEGPQPRQTPEAGCRVGPYELPGGVRIATMAYTLHRDAVVFPDPETWDHTRWIGADDEAKKARNRQFWAFGSGSRMCIANHFAMHELKAIAAMIYSRFKTHIVDDSMMDPEDKE